MRHINATSPGRSGAFRMTTNSTSCDVVLAPAEAPTQAGDTPWQTIASSACRHEEFRTARSLA